jgi:hypothetical protein
MGDLDGVAEHVLAVTCAVFLTAQELDQLGMQAVDIGLEYGPLALRLDGRIHLPLGFFHHFLDAGGVDAAVDDKLFQRQARDFAADGVETGDGNGLRSVVDNEIHAGQGLQRADIAALAADNAPLHLALGRGTTETVASAT